MSSRTKRVSTGIVWSVISKVTSTLFPFFVRTAFIYRLGADYLGLNSLFVSILQILSLAELGFSSAVVYCMYEPAAKGDDSHVLALLTYFKRIYRIVGLVITLVGVCVVPLLPFIVNGDVPDDINMYVVYAIFLFNTSVSYFMASYRQSLFNAFQRNDLVSVTQLAVVVIQNSVQMAFLLLGCSYYAYAIVLPVATIAGNVITAFISKREFPQFFNGSIDMGRLEEGERKVIIDKVKGLLIQKVCILTRDSCDSIIISASLGLTLAGKYNNYFLIMSSLLALVETIRPPLTASVGNSIALESPQKNFYDMRRLCWLFSFVSIFASACLLGLFQSFIKLWIGSEYLLSTPLAALLCLYFYVRTMGDVRASYDDATGMWSKLKLCSVLQAIFNLLLNLLFVQILGIEGVVLATVLSLFVIEFCYGSRIVFREYFGIERVKQFYGDYGFYFVAWLITCSASLAFNIAFRGLGLEGLFAFTIELVGTCFIALIVDVTFLSRSKLFSSITELARRVSLLKPLLFVFRFVPTKKIKKG